MSIRVLLVAAMVVGLVASIVTIGSQAFFGDSELIPANVVDAGELDIKINGVDAPPCVIGPPEPELGRRERREAKPYHPPREVLISNSGQNDGHLDLHYNITFEDGGNLTEPECQAMGGAFNPNGGGPGIPTCDLRPDEPIGPGNPIPDTAECIAQGGTEAPLGTCTFPTPVPIDNLSQVFDIDLHEAVTAAFPDEPTCLGSGGIWFPPGATPQAPPAPPAPFITGAGFGHCYDVTHISPQPLLAFNSLCMEMGTITSGSDRLFLLTYHLQGSAGNEWQGDKLQFDVEWTLHQPNDPAVHNDFPIGSLCGTNAPGPIGP